MSIEFVRQFVAEYGGLETVGKMSTTMVCESIVKPATLDRRCAYIDKFRIHQTVDGGTKPLMGPASVFVSHAWKYAFGDPVDVMEQYERAHPDSYFWFDVFMNNQHKAETRPQSWWSTTFRLSIKSIGVVLIVMAPWDNPIPISRAWCLWEIICALGQKGVVFSVMLPVAQQDALKEGVLKDPSSIINV